MVVLSRGGTRQASFVDIIGFKDLPGFLPEMGLEKKVGQAIALTLDGDDIVLDHCVIRAHQDSLFLAPLPER